MTVHNVFLFINLSLIQPNYKPNYWKIMKLKEKELKWKIMREWVALTKFR
jgi:hypothetical protein